MAQRDAFGNPVDEDPIKAMGWEAPTGATTTPTALRLGDQVHRADAASLSAGLGDAASDLGRQAQSALSTGDLGALVRTRRSRRSAASAFGGRPRIPFLGGFVRLAIFVAIAAWILPVGQIVDAVRDVRDTVEEIDGSGAGGGGGLPLAPGQEQEAQPEPEAASPLTTAGFTAALTAARRTAGAGSRPSLVRVDATSLIVQASTTDGATRLVRVVDGEASVVSETRGTPGAGTFGWSAVDRRAPARLVNQLGAVENAVLLRAPRLGWTALSGGRSHRADRAGRNAKAS